MAIQPHSRIESQLTDPTYKGPYLSRIELILKDMLENYGRIAFVGPYDSLEDLPETGQAGYVYLVRVEGSNLCDEYIWDEQEEEYNYVGRFEIDLDAYATKAEVEEIRLSISNLSASVLLKQSKELETPITVDQTMYTTVEAAMNAMNISLSGKISTSNTPGLVKNDGTIDQTEYEKSGVAETLVKDTVGWSGKNLLPMTVDGIKAANTIGTWNGNIYSINGGTVEVLLDNADNVLGFKVNGTFSANSYLVINDDFDSSDFVGCYANGLPNVGAVDTFMYRMCSQNDFVSIADISVNDSNIQNVGDNLRFAIRFGYGYSASNTMFYPMLRKADIADSTFEPYHATVDTVKADKVSSPTVNDLASLDSNGNLADSGISKEVLSTDTITTTAGNPVTFATKSAQIAEWFELLATAKQDLHGYDYPWPAGGGKNKLPLVLDDIKAVNTSGTWSGNVYSIANGTIEILVDNGGNVTGIKANGTFNEQVLFYINGSVENQQSIIFNGVEDGSAFTYSINMYFNGSFAGDVYDGDSSTYTIPASVDYTYMIVLRSGYNASNLMFYPMIRDSSVSDATFAPYSNICPIVGFSEKNVKRCGRNIWNERLELGSINSNGENAPSSSELRSIDYMRVKPNTDYYFYEGFSPAYHDVYFYDENKSFISQDSTDVTAFTTPLNAHFMRFMLNSIYGITYRNDICISISDASFNGHYEPYIGIDYIINFGDTVYGVKVTEHGCEATHVIVDLSTLSWGKANIQNDKWEFIATQYGIKPVGPGTRPDALCSIYAIRTRSFEYEGNMGLALNPDYNQICVCDTNYSTDQEFSDSLDNNCVLCYELATPIPLPISPIALALLAGTNVLTTDGDSIKVTYRDGVVATMADIVAEDERTDAKLAERLETKAEISAIANSEPNATASQPYAVGEHFYKDGKFCTVIAQIASGATLTKNTNYVEGTIADNLIKQDTFSGTTNDDGSKLISTSVKNVVGVKIENINAIAQDYLVDNSYTFIRVNSASTGEKMANTYISGVYYYI